MWLGIDRLEQLLHQQKNNIFIGMHQLRLGSSDFRKRCSQEACRKALNFETPESLSAMLGGRAACS